MPKRSKTAEEDRASQDSLMDIIRAGAQQLIAQALKAEVTELLATYADQRDEQGHARVVLSGHHPARDIQTGMGPVTVRVPKVRSRQGDPVTFHSALVPPYVRKTASLEAAIPWLYLKGISTGEMQVALESLVGPEAKGCRPVRWLGSSRSGGRNTKSGGTGAWMLTSGSTSGWMASIVADGQRRIGCVRWSLLA